MENDPLIGQQLGAYCIQSRLGEGGMARVYKAYHERLRREAAIKVILSQVAAQAGFKARFEREAELIARLQHPNIVAVYDSGEIGNLTYLVMQYVGGGTLRDLLGRGHALDPRQAILYAIQMARALHHAHLRGIVHRDVKPQNMLVSSTDPNQLLLSDFGIAKLFDTRYEPTLVGPTGSSRKNDPSLTNVDQIVGTAEYMAPEQINVKPVDARTDVYSLGVVLFQMLTGEVPFHSTTVQGLLFQHVYTPPRPIQEINPYVPEILAQIVAKAMAKAPEDRFQSAEEMAQALEAANIFITNRLSTSLPPGAATPAPGSGISPTPPAPDQPIAYYGPQPTASQPGQHSVYPPHTGLVSQAKAAWPRMAGRVPVSYIGVGLVILLAISLILASYIPMWFAPPQQTSFTETFQDNHRNWTVGNLDNGNFTASVNSTGYRLAAGNLNNTYFPHPDGTLPNNFTLTVQMEQTGGAPGVFYGLAFRFTQDGSGVHCYALVINGNGQYEVLKYDPAAAHGYSPLWQYSQAWSNIHRGLNQTNTFQASVNGSSFSFKINNTLVPVNNPPGQTLTDTTYTGGQLAIVVAGPNTGFLVTSVQLATA